MTEDLIDLIANDGRRNAAGGIYSTRVYEFANAIEAEATAPLLARIAELEAQIATVAPAVDAQPVAIYQVQMADDSWMDVSHEDLLDLRPEETTRTVYASAQSEGLRKALTEIAEQEHIELMLDPTWAQRIAIAAMSQHTGEKDD